MNLENLKPAYQIEFQLLNLLEFCLIGSKSSFGWLNFHIDLLKVTTKSRTKNKQAELGGRMYTVKVFQKGSLTATEERKMSIIDCTDPEPKGEDVEVSLLGHFLLPSPRESGIYKLNQPIGETIKFDIPRFIHPEGKELKYELLDAVAVVEVEDMDVKKYSIHVRAKKISVARILLVAILEGRLSPSNSFEKPQVGTQEV